MTSDDSETSFRERVEEIREERAEGEDRGSSTDAEFDGDPIKAIAIFIGGLFAIGLIIGAIQSGNFLLVAIILGVIFALISLFVDEDGELMESLQQQQQQETDSKSEPKRICSACGWQNPQANNFCHDCGSELDAN